jgi:N-formylglutamate amidohydrolase
LPVRVVALATSAVADERDGHNRLLAPNEPAAITVRNKDGQSPFLIVVDHAGNAIPRARGRLGVARAELERHIAWDIGVAAVSRFLADALDAALARQNYSRLVIDCNRAGVGDVDSGNQRAYPDPRERRPKRKSKARARP